MTTDSQTLRDAIERAETYLERAISMGVERSIIGRQGPGLSMEDLRNLLDAIPSTDAGQSGELTADFLRSLPGGKLDDSAYQDIEEALDRLEAPMRRDGDSGPWLTLAQRVAALTRSTEDSRGGGLAATEVGSQAARLLDQYAAFIRDHVAVDDLELHPYLPEIEQVLEDLRATPASDGVA